MVYSWPSRSFIRTGAFLILLFTAGCFAFTPEVFDSDDEIDDRSDEVESLEATVHELESEATTLRQALADAESRLETAESRLETAETYLQQQDIQLGDPVQERERVLNTTETEWLVHERVNRERLDHGVDELAFDPALAAIARAHSRDMDERGYFSHVTPDGDDVDDRIAAGGYECDFVHEHYRYYGGENLVQTNFRRNTVWPDATTRFHSNESEVADGTVDLWLGSPGHKENMLAAPWRNQGIGIHFNETSRKVFVTQKLC